MLNLNYEDFKKFLDNDISFFKNIPKFYIQHNSAEKEFINNNNILSFDDISFEELEQTYEVE